MRYLRAQSAKEPESARWVGVLDVRVPHGYKGGCSVRSTPISFIRPRLTHRLPKGYGPALEAPARRRGRLCAGVTWRATDWIHLFTMHAYFLARKVGGRKMDPELRVEPFSRTSQAFVRNETCCSVSLTLGNAAMFSAGGSMALSAYLS